MDGFSFVSLITFVMIFPSLLIVPLYQLHQSIYSLNPKSLPCLRVGTLSCGSRLYLKEMTESSPHCHLVVELHSLLLFRVNVGAWLRIAQSPEFLPYRGLLTPPQTTLLCLFGIRGSKGVPAI
jgi:hypothetical protein